MVTIPDNIYSAEKNSPPEAAYLFPGASDKSFTSAFLSASTTHHIGPVTMPAEVDSLPAEVSDVEMDFSRYIDIPLLVSDHEEDDSDNESHVSKKTGRFPNEEATPPPPAEVQELKRSIKKEETVESQETPAKVEKAQSDLTVAEFELERSKIMKIVVKYIAMKISNSFPPESSRTIDANEIPLDKFLMILVSRLQMTLPVFMRGIIYLFRYMDIIYLLRYLNQSNNFANYTDMGYGLKKLIIGCFKLSLARERITKDWSTITGLSTSEINRIVKTLVSRLNGKLVVKGVELVRLKSEIFRFVKMVTQTV